MTPRHCAALFLLVVLGAGCGGADDVVFTADEVVVYDADAVPETTVVVTPSGPVVIDRIWSPEAATAEVLGAGALPSDPVMVDDEPADVLLFDVDDAGSFTLRVRIVEDGAHTVCVRDVCGRVFVADPAEGG